MTSMIAMTIMPSATAANPVTISPQNGTGAEGTAPCVVFLRETSHRISAKVDQALGRHPQHYWRSDDRQGGIYIKLLDQSEIEKALAAGAKKCRQQDHRVFRVCWRRTPLSQH